MSLYDESLVDQIAKVLRQQRRPTVIQTTIDDSKRPSGGGGQASIASRFQVEHSRTDRVHQSRKMYDEDGRFKQICATIARDAVKGGFQLELGQPNAQAMEIAEALRDRLGLDKRLDDWARLTLRDGDSMLEIGVSAERLIEEVTRKPTLKMHRNSDNRDRFSDPTKAYWYASQEYALYPPGDAIWFAEWQIIHARWEHDEGSRYGRPLMSSSRKAWKRVSEGETDVAVRRKTRAGMRYHHVVEGDDGDVEAYKARNKAVLDNPFIGIADFFSNKPGGITSIQGDSNIGQIEDLIYHLDTWWIESPVQKAILGYGRDLNRDVLRDQKEQYDETLDGIKEWVADQIVKPLLELQWLLAGILPDSLDYDIKWPVKAIVTPEDILKIAQAVQVLRVLGVQDDVIAMLLARFLPGVTQEMLAGSLQSSANDAGRLAKIAAQLAGVNGANQ